MKKMLLIIALVSFNNMLSQIGIIESNNPEEIILDGLIGNPNFPASNFVLSTGTDFGDVYGAGLFIYSGTDFPFDRGIVLASGDVNAIPGANINTINTGSNTWLGDADLDASSGSTTYNASFIAFDFIAEVEMISLDFLMASEEYFSGFECAFSDSFAFILTNNTTGVSENIALVPETTMPIAVTTVHGGQDPSCPAVNEAYFKRYNYEVANTDEPYILAEDSPIDLNGQTEVFVLMGDLDIGTSYTIKIVIADASDSFFDSALFVRNSSFGAFPIIDTEPSDLVLEDTDESGFEVFDLTLNEAQMLGSVNTSVYSFLFSYYTSLEDAESGINAIASPETYTNTSDLQTIYVTMENTYTGTRITDDFRITINSDLLSVEDFDINDVVLYPNPVRDKLFIDVKTLNIEKVQIYSINGQLLEPKYYIDGSHTIAIDFSDLSSGMYLVKLTSENGSIFKRVLK